MMNKIVAIQGDHPSKLNPRTDTSVFLANEIQNKKYKIFYYCPKDLSIIDSKRDERAGRRTTMLDLLRFDHIPGLFELRDSSPVGMPCMRLTESLSRRPDTWKKASG